MDFLRDDDVIEGQCVDERLMSPAIYEQTALYSNCFRLTNFRSSTMSRRVHVYALFDGAL